MIISFSRDFVFCPIPRTGTHTLRHTLRPHLAPTDWEQVGLGEPKAFPVAPLARYGHGHLPLAEVRPVIDFLRPGWWDSATVFTVVRDPTDRFLSACRLHYPIADIAGDPSGVMRHALTDPQKRRHFLFRPQVELLLDDQRAMMPDVVCRFERLQRDIETLFEAIGLPAGELPHHNAAPKADLVIDGKVAELLSESYEADYDLLGYSLPNR